MWEKWNDMFMGVLWAACVVLLCAGIWGMIWGFLPTKQLGYHIREEVVEKGRIRYYTVEAVRQHACDRTIYTTTDFEEALAVMRQVQEFGEAE